MIATVESADYLGIHAYPVKVEVDVSNGLPQFVVVGLPDVSIKESRERVKTAIRNSGYMFPSDKVTINLAPADIKKEGPAFDLPMALGILAAGGFIAPESLKPYLILGELALDGSLRSIKGAVIIASQFAKTHSFILPKANAEEASLIQGATIYPADKLEEVVRFLNGEFAIEPMMQHIDHALTHYHDHPLGFDFSEVKGQRFAKRAVEIAVAGGHNLLLIGPPGSGKTMLARRIPTILPPLSFEEALEMTKVYSAAGLLSESSQLMTRRPFRTPHHTASAIAMVGGGTWPKPGEVSLAHGGVLFLDEFPEFRRDVIESLRNPIEDRSITVSRVKQQVLYPSHFMLVASMNPCPCGHLSDPRKSCRCSLKQILKYQSKVSGPILDRIDLHVETPSLSYQTLVDTGAEESSQMIRSRILACRKIQKKRFQGLGYTTNADMRAKEIKKFSLPDASGQKLLEMAMKELRLSARAYFKILKIARTVSDLAECEQIEASHIAEAIQYRSLDRQWRT